MLVLTRKKDEQIRIGDDIIITVIRVKGKSVRLGIQAPRTEPVLRGELEFREPGGAAANDAHEVEGLSVVESATSQHTAPSFRPQRPLRDFLSTTAARQ